MMLTIFSKAGTNPVMSPSDIFVALHNATPANDGVPRMLVKIRGAISKIAKRSMSEYMEAGDEIL